MRNMFDSGICANRADRDYCARMIRQGSRSFYAASLLLPLSVREPAYAIYAFCRYSDDVVDIDGGDKHALARLYQRLDAAYNGAPADSPIDRAFSDVVLIYDVPKALPAALLEGLSWDVGHCQYQSLDALMAYATRVAGAVGAIMSVLMGARSASAIARASDLGVAMQLTNIARDIGEDALGGRVYLPLDWLNEEGVDLDAFLRAPEATIPIRSLTNRLLDSADFYYEQGMAGIELLPRQCRTAIAAAAYIYRDIGRVIRANGYDAVTQRAATSLSSKLRLAAIAMAARQYSSAPINAPPLKAAEFLVEAVRGESSGSAAGLLKDASLGSVIDMFMRLEKRDRAVVSGAS